MPAIVIDERWCVYASFHMKPYRILDARQADNYGDGPSLDRPRFGRGDDERERRSLNSCSL